MTAAMGDASADASPDVSAGFSYNAIDRFSHFTGIAVSLLFLVAAFVTLWEVFARYVLNAPTSWAFELVMVLCAACWMLSAGFVTLQKRHIAVTVVYDISSDRNKHRLEAFSTIVGIGALFLLLADATTQAITSIHEVERTGSAFNSPMPMLLKTLLMLGGYLYLAQLCVNLHRHLAHPSAKRAVVFAAGLMLLWFVASILVQLNGPEGALGAIGERVGAALEAIDPSEALDLRSYGLGWISIVMVIALIGLMMTGMPLGIVTLAISVVMAIAFFGFKGLYLVSSNTAELLESYTLVAIPFFVLMASILERAGIAEDLFDAMSIFAGNLRGGVAVQTVVVAVILAAMSGVMGGEIVMLGLVALPQMLRLGYDRKLSVGLICASGALATLIPPSIVMIVYGLSAEVGIGDLFMGGFVPGLMLALFYVLFVLVRVNLNPSLAPTASEAATRDGIEPKRLSRARLQAVFMSIALIGGVMGSIYFGIASVTEAAAVGTIGALLVAAVRGGFQWAPLKVSLVTSMATVGTIVWLVMGAISFVGIYNLVGGADFMRSLILGLGLPPMGVVLIMMLILMVLGTFMEWIAIVFITVPVFAPVVATLAPELGMSADDAKLWFGILFVMNIQIYFLSPPFGPACFWLKSVAPKEISLQEIFVAVLPFIGLQILGLCLVIYFPDIALWLPRILN